MTWLKCGTRVRYQPRDKGKTWLTGVVQGMRADGAYCDVDIDGHNWLCEVASLQVGTMEWTTYKHDKLVKWRDVE
jgi:hypothetical protein